MRSVYRSVKMTAAALAATFSLYGCAIPILAAAGATGFGAMYLGAKGDKAIAAKRADDCYAIETSGLKGAALRRSLRQKSCM